MARFSHFGVNIRPGEMGPKLTRENYAIVDKKSTVNEHLKACLNVARNESERGKWLSLYKGVYEDESVTTYTDQWFKKQRRKALFNLTLI